MMLRDKKECFFGLTTKGTKGKDGVRGLLKSLRFSILVLGIVLLFFKGLFVFL